MKTNARWLAIPTALAMVFSTLGAVRAETVTFSGGSRTISGNVSGGQSNCDQLSGPPTHTVTLSQDFKTLMFSVSGSGQPILKVTGPGGQSNCVMASEFSGGKAEIPGFWNQGTYSIRIGDRVSGNQSHTLLIKQ